MQHRFATLLIATFLICHIFDLPQCSHVRQNVVFSANQVFRVGRKIGEQKNTVVETASSREEGKRIGGQKNILLLDREASAMVARSVSEEAAIQPTGRRTGATHKATTSPERGLR